jgi:hypothetical protein
MMDPTASERVDSRSSGPSPYSLRLVLSRVAILCWLVAGASVAAAAPPVVAILQPPDSSVLPDGDEIAFLGTANDVEDGDISAAISWASNVDGPLGVGASINVGLTPGTHQIMAIGVDSDGLSGSDSIAIVVNARPVVTITSPSDGAELSESEPIVFNGVAFDTEDGDLSFNLSWSSDLDGILGSGSSVSVDMSTGMHVVTAAVVDRDGLMGNASITIQVSSSGSQHVPALGPVGLGLLACLLGATGIAGTGRVARRVPRGRT